MIELDDDLRAARDAAREMADDLRGRALAIDADPDAMDEHLNSFVYDVLRISETPLEFRESHPGAPKMPDGASLPDRGNCLMNVVSLIEAARGDLATVLAAPAPGLPGVLIQVLGDQAQRELFFTRLHGGRTWPFFAMTEATHGSDAGAMDTRFEPDGAGGWLLYGTKRFIGNAARGGVGMVFGRTGRSPLSIRAALVELPAPGWSGVRLDTVGLRGAYLSELTFDGVPVAPEMMLGAHLPVAQRGLWGALKTFNQVRLRVASGAVGTALAMVEYVGEHRKTAPGLDVAEARAEAGRQAIYEAAARLDRNPERAYWSSAVKLAAVDMAVATGRWAARVMGPGGLLEHPLLEKWCRDVCAFEFMDGTSNMQRLHIERGYQTGDADG
jgi:alkylation response protein AidB-like acyl-CoA dehydrogenase